MQKKATASYFNFTRKERTGTIALLCFIFLIMWLPALYPLLFKPKLPPVSDLEKTLALLKTNQARPVDKFINGNSYPRNTESYPHFSNKNKKNEYVLFNFDPNTIDADGWSKLGVKEKTISTIFNFIAKGGRFKEPEDIKKIWGLQEKQAEELMKYVSIRQVAHETKFTKSALVVERYESKKTIHKVDINTADTAAFIGLPGIGPKLSARIILFREKLGGFTSIDQVGETFGLADSVFQKIKPLLVFEDKGIKQIDINAATPDELKSHPYIRYVLANAIVQYRTQHGHFSDVSGLKKIMLINEEVYARISPYLIAK